MPTRERKEEYFVRMDELLDKYQKILVVTADHVGSQQFHQIRHSLRGVAVVLMGKNTMMRKVIQLFLKKHKDHPIDALLPYVRGNIGLIFTNEDLSIVRRVIAENRIPAAARIGVMAECDVIVPPGPTGCDPGQTSWFQALNVPTKITKGQIEIVSELKLITKGERVGSSEAALLQKLNIRPFTYGLILQQVYDSGSVFEAAVLDITEADLRNKFITALRRFAAISLASGYPTLASVPHSVGRAVKRLIAISAEAGYSFKQMAEWDKLLNMDPAELAKLQAAAKSAGGASAGAAAAQEEKKEEEEEVAPVQLGGMFPGGEAADGY